MQRPLRPTILVVMLAIIAAVLLLGTRLMFDRQDQPTVAGTAPAQTRSRPVVNAAPVPAPAPPQPTTDGQQAAESAAEPRQPAAIKPVTVRVEALQNEATDAASRAAIDAFHMALLDGLRAVPGLELGAPDAAAAANGDYRLTIRGTGMPQENKFRIDLRASAAGGFTQPFQVVGEIAPECAGASGCGDAVSMAGTLVKLLSSNLLPDLSLPGELRDRLLDSTRPPQQRASALSGLETVRADGSRNPARSGPEAKELLRDPAVVRGAVGLAATAMDGAIRAQVWRSMRGVRHVDLVQPLIAALDQDPDNRVRVEAVTTLAADFTDDPRVRAALETAARGESRAIRVLAQRGLAGEAEWNRQVTASLGNASLSALERIEPLFHTLNQAGLVTDPRQLLADDASIRAFAQVLPRAAEAPQADPRLTAVLLSRLGMIDHPAVTDLLLGTLAGSPDAGVRRTALGFLAGSIEESRVRTALEKASAGDADPRLRELAAKALREAAAQSPTR